MYEDKTMVRLAIAVVISLFIGFLLMGCSVAHAQKVGDPEEKVLRLLGEPTTNIPGFPKIEDGSQYIFGDPEFAGQLNYDTWMWIKKDKASMVSWMDTGTRFSVPIVYAVFNKRGRCVKVYNVEYVEYRDADGNRR